MAKRYIKIGWENKPSVKTPVNMANLGRMDKGIDDCDNAIEEIYSKRVNNVVTTNEDTFLAGPVGKVLQDQVTELNKNTTLLNATFENVDILDKARTMPKGFTPISLSTGLTNKPTGWLADYSNGFVLNRGGDTYTIFIINRTTGDIYTNTWNLSTWTGWKSVGLTTVSK